MVDPMPLEELIPRLRRVHEPGRCAGTHCVIHNPSDHHMRSWPVQYESWNTLVVRVCHCNNVHPDPDSAAALDRIYERTWGDSHFRHNCGCNCCDERIYEANLPPLMKLMLALDRGEITEDAYNDQLEELL